MHEAERKRGIRLMEEAVHGSTTANRLLLLADAIQSGTKSEAAAIDQGRKIIEQATR